MNKEVPLPRIRGKSYQREDKLWSWEMNITIGDMPMEEGIVMGYPDTDPGFLSKDLAIQNMKGFIPGVVDKISEVYGEKPTGFFDLKTNTLKEKL